MEPKFRYAEPRAAVPTLALQFALKFSRMALRNSRKLSRYKGAPGELHILFWPQVEVTDKRRLYAGKP